MEIAYRSGGQALVRYKEHWYYLNINTYENERIDMVHFVNDQRVEEVKTSLLKDGAEELFDEWSAAFKKEAEKKLLDEAEAYRGFFERDEVNLVVGFTTDTLQAVPNTPDRIQALVEEVAREMKEGMAGPYLRFKI